MQIQLLLCLALYGILYIFSGYYIFLRDIIYFSDLDARQIRQIFDDGCEVVPAWQPFYCILRQDLKTLTCHRSEEVSYISYI